MCTRLEAKGYQTVMVMRHGDRMDVYEPSWISTASRPWDPPLAEDGKLRAFSTGRSLLKSQLSIHRVIVSPFLRCVQTANEVVKALCDDSSHAGVLIDPSKLKVCFEYGLCEMMNSAAIRNGVAPNDGNFTFNLSELEAILPAGVFDHSVESVYKEPPHWEEPIPDSYARYKHIVHALADKYPSENLLLVTHGQCVGDIVSAFLNDVTVYEVDYCAYARLRRPIFEEKDNKSSFESFELLTEGQTGIGYLPPSSEDPIPFRKGVMIR